MNWYSSIMCLVGGRARTGMEFLTAFSIGSYQCKWMNHWSLFVLKLSAQGSPSSEASGIAVWDLKYELCECCIDFTAELWILRPFHYYGLVNYCSSPSLPPPYQSLIPTLGMIQPFEEGGIIQGQKLYHTPTLGLKDKTIFKFG